MSSGNDKKYATYFTKKVQDFFCCNLVILPFLNNLQDAFQYLGN